MLQGTLIDLILLRVNGGELTDDGAVQRSDIRSYLPIALNQGTTQFYYNNKKEELSRDFPACFYAWFPNLTINRANKVAQITLPQLALQMPSNQGIRRIQDNNGDTFTPVQDGEVCMINYYSECYPDLRLFLPIGFQTIQLYNISSFATYVNALIMLDPSSFTDDTVLPIAAGLEATIIDLCIQHFTGQRQQPADTIVDTNDLNAN